MFYGHCPSIQYFVDCKHTVYAYITQFNSTFCPNFRLNLNLQQFLIYFLQPDPGDTGIPTKIKLQFNNKFVIRFILTHSSILNPCQYDFTRFFFLLPKNRNFTIELTLVQKLAANQNCRAQFCATSVENFVDNQRDAFLGWKHSLVKTSL